VIIVILTFDGDLDRAPEVVGPFMDEASRMAWVNAIQPEHPGVEFLLTTTTEPWQPDRYYHVMLARYVDRDRHEGASVVVDLATEDPATEDPA